MKMLLRKRLGGFLKGGHFPDAHQNTDFSIEGQVSGALCAQ